MASRKLKAEVMVEHFNGGAENPAYTVVTLKFNRKLSNLEVSGIKAVMDGDIS